MGTSVAVGVLAVLAPIAVVGSFLLTMGVIVAWMRPTFAIAACLITASFHRGLFLYLRIEPGGYPVSVFDVLPLLLLLASVSLALKERRPDTPPRALLAVCGAMILSGLIVGVALGTSRAAADYELVRVVRLEILILCAIAAAFIAGHVPQWRRGILTGLVGVAVCVAVQLLVTFSWSLATGNYFWSLFPFGRTLDINLLGEVQTGNILTLRENAISAFLILPALSLIVFRFKGRDVAVLMLLVAGGLVWLSRGLWVAMFLTLLITLAHRATSGRLSGVRFGAIALPVMVVVSVVFLASGGILGQRLGETTDLGGDSSLQTRANETQANLTALGQGPGPLLFGLGTGVVVSAEGSSALLENSVLATWTNTGLLGLIGVTVIFFGAALRGWRLAANGHNQETAALGAMSLALPILWLQGLVGGTFSVPEPTLALFLLAATVIVTPVEGRRSFPRIAATRLDRESETA